MALNSYDVVRGNAGSSTDSIFTNRNPPWWKQRTSMERYGIMFLLISVIAIVALIIALVMVILERDRKRPEDEICTTPGCVAAAAGILKSMDQSVDPCDDFYEFACGAFQREAIIPDDKVEVGPLDDLEDLVEVQLRAVFEEPQVANEIKPFRTLKKFYTMCLDTEAIEDLSRAKRLVKTLGGWPVLEGSNWDGSGFDWSNSMQAFRRNGFRGNSFVKVDVEIDLENSSQRSIYLDQVAFSIDRENLLSGFDNKVVNAFYNYTIDLAVLLGADRIRAEYDMKNMVEFIIHLANISLTEAEHREQLTSCHTLSVLQLQRQYPPINWTEYLNKVIDLPHQTITDTQRVSLISAKYLRKIGYILEKTSKRTQANYAIFRALNSIGLFLPKSIRDRAQQFEAAVNGVSKRLPRWKECVEKTTSKFQIAAGAMYVRKFFKADAKESVIEMIGEIKRAFIKTLEETDWMDESTRRNAVEKALAIESHAAYPTEFLDDRKIEDYYAELKNNFDNIFDFLGNLTMFELNKDFKMLSEAVNKSDWRTRSSVVDVNAAYDFQENSVEITAATLQGFLFNKDRMQSLNYGRMGFFIGHEVTHGFDDQGRKYDKDGNLATWWDPDISEAFLQKAECIIEQYSNYTLPGTDKPIDGRLTQGENIADNGGIKQAYRAYKAWIQRNGPESKLPGLNYTAEQLFWISAATPWCSKERKESLQSSLTDVHSPARFRVLGAFSNTDDFAKDFGCASASKMNPERKCKVW